MRNKTIHGRYVNGIYSCTTGIISTWVEHTWYWVSDSIGGSRLYIAWRNIDYRSKPKDLSSYLRLKIRYGFRIHYYPHPDETRKQS